MIFSKDGNEISSCYLCGSNNSRDLYKNNNLVKCNNCGFVFYKYLPDKKTIDDIYSGYSRDSYITDESHKKITSTLKKILSFQKIQKVLDIACGECYYLDALREIDPSIELFASEHISAKENVISKGYSFVEGELFPVCNNKYDLIIFTEAIEHINTPIQFLSHAKKLLNNDGLIYITTPCFSSIERLITKENWYHIMPPEHLGYFTKKTLNSALDDTGFKKIYVKSFDISVVSILESLKTNNSIQNLSNQDLNTKNIQETSDKIQSIVSNNKLLFFLKKIVNQFLNIFGLGSSLQGLYRVK